MENRFRIIIPVYNAENYIKRCLESLSNQDYTNWTAVIVNDTSTDNTRSIIDDFIKSDERYKVIHRRKNTGKPIHRRKNTGNVKAYIDGVVDCDGEDIIVHLDGDDYLYCSDALSYLNEIYQDENIWLTYGNFLCENGARPISHKISPKTLRRWDHLWNMHLRTYK